MVSDSNSSLFNRALYFISMLSGNLTSFSKLYSIHQLISFLQFLIIPLNLLLKTETYSNKLLIEAASLFDFLDNPIMVISQSSETIVFIISIYIISLIIMHLLLFLKIVLSPFSEDSIPSSSSLGNFLSIHTEVFLYWMNNFLLSSKQLEEFHPLLFTVTALNSLLSFMRVTLAFVKVDCNELLYRKSCQHQVFILLAKSAIPFIMRLNPNDLLVAKIICLICGCLSFYQILKKLPEKDDFILKIQCLFVSMACYISVVGIFCNFFNQLDLGISMVGHSVFIAPVIGKVSLVVIESRLESLKEAKRLDNPYFICHLLDMIKKIKQDLAWNYQQKKFSASLLSSLCILEANFSLESKMTKLDLKTYSSETKIFIKNIFESNMKKFFDVGTFMLAYSNLIGLNFKMNLKARNLIEEISNRFRYDIPALITTLIIKSKMKSKRMDSALDTNIMIQIERNFNSIKKLIDSFLVESAIFWESIDLSEIKTSRIAKLTKTLSRLISEIDRAWSESRSMYIKNHYALPFLIYGVYARNFKYDIKLSAECIRKYQTLVFQDLIFNSFDLENQAVFSVSANNNTLGHVLSHSNSTFKLFGLKNSIIGQNINKIMPDFFARRHQKFLKNHIENGKTSIMNKKVKIYAKDNQEFIFPIYLEVKVEFNQDQGIVFKGIVTKIAENKEAIIVNEKGFIEEYSSKIQEVLNLEKLLYFPQILDLKMKHGNPRQTLEQSIQENFKEFILRLAIPLENSESPQESFTNYRLLSFKASNMRKFHSESEEVFHHRLIHQYYVSYFEYKFESETIFVIILEDISTHHDFFYDGDESADNLDIAHEKPEPNFTKRVSNEVLKALLKKRNIEELPSSLKQNNKTPIDPKKLAYNNSLGSSGSLSSNSIIKIEEIQQTLLHLPEDKFQNALKGLMTIFLIVNIFLAIFMFFFSENILSKVLSALDSVNYSYQRMDSLVWVWRFAIGYQIRVKGISSPTPIDLSRQRQVIMMYAPKLKAANDALLNQIWQSPGYIQDQAFAKNVRMNITDEYGNVETMNYNTFEATYAYLDMVVRFNKTPDSITMVPNQPYIKYLLDNGANDLLIETEKVINLFKSEVFRIFTVESGYLNTIFGIIIALYIVSIFIVLAIVISFYKKTKKLFIILSLLNKAVIQSMKEEIKYFKSALEINNTRNLNKMGEKNIFQKPQEKRLTKLTDKRSRVLGESSKKILMKPYFMRKILRFILVILFNLVTIILSSISFQQYTASVSTYFENNNYLTTASYNRYLYTFVIAANYYALANQYTGFIRNIPTVNAIPKLIQLISSNDLSMSVYTDSDGFKTPFLKEIFESRLCPYILYFSFPGKDMNAECAILTRNYTYALVGVNLLVYQESRAISQILIEDHSYANCKKLYSRFNNNVGPGTYVLGAAYEVIYNSMKQNFDDLRLVIDKNLLKNFIIQVLVSSLLMILIILMIYHTENEKLYGETLMLIPVGELISNNMVKFMAIEIYGKRLEPLRGVKIKDIKENKLYL